ncbi:MAG: hypothetical protein ACRD96_05355 [Bryobacteraceae bacterium]
MTILERIDASLADFRPRNQREFVALQLARRFNDLPNLAKYLIAAKQHTKRDMLQAAKDAKLRHELNRAPISQLFFEILSERDQPGGIQ